MEQKRIWAMYFSATGTTERIVCRIADRLAAQLGRGAAAGDAQAARLDFTLPGAREKSAAFSQGDLVIFGVPVYAGRVPNVLLPYLRTVDGGGAQAAPVVLYGNRDFDDALIELRDLLEEDGFRTVAGAAFIGEHSFSKVLAAGRPDEADLLLADRFADGLAEALATGKNMRTPAAVRGQSPLRGYYQPRDRMGTPIDIRKVKPLTDDRCDACGICAAACPMGSIDPDDARRFTGICIKCGACIKKCPQGAKYYDDPGYLYHKEELELGYERRAEPALFLPQE